MPLLTRASAADLTRSSVTLQAKRFQLFQPMGGVRARPFSRACTGRTEPRNARNKSKINERNFLRRALISSPAPIVFSKNSPANSVRRLMERRHHSLQAEEPREERDFYAPAVAAIGAASAV